jgi:DNA-binding XRE family transcriptional regulator
LFEAGWNSVILSVSENIKRTENMPIVRPHPIPRKEMAKVLFDLRRTLRWTQAKAASVIGVHGVHLNTYRNWENGVVNPTRRHLAQLANAFGQSEQYLRFGYQFLKRYPPVLRNR